jgi:hypothetical protein
MDLTDHYTTLLAELDKTLSLVRSFWIESRDEFEKRKNQKRLDELLDERLRLMRARDAAEATKRPVETPFVKSVKVKKEAR